MQNQAGFDRCRSFIDCQLGPKKAGKADRQPGRFRAVTLSRQTGSGAHAIAEALAVRLAAQEKAPGRPWTVFDRELVARVLEDHNLPAKMADSIPEDRMTELQDAVDELFGLRPGSWAFVQQTSETILRLVELGHVILIGRAANIVTRHREDVLHVRLVAPEQERVQRLQADRQLTRKSALAIVRQEDLGRARYVRKYFETDINEPSQYHLTLNTAWLGQERAVELLSDLMLSAR
jgi:cytidylate kinase